MLVIKRKIFLNFQRNLFANVHFSKIYFEMKKSTASKSTLAMTLEILSYRKPPYQ